MKQRVISAAVALAIVIPLLILRGIPLAIGIGVVSLLGLKEIFDLKKSHKTIPIVVELICTISLLFLIFGNFDAYTLAFGISYQAVAILMLGLLIPTIFYAKNEKYNTHDAFYLIGSTLLLGVFFQALFLITNENIWEFVYLFMITSFTDMFAYFIGKLIGQHKNAEAISPNKTWEGSIGGTLVGTFVASVFYLNVVSPNANMLLVIGITLVLSIIGQLGDLLFSKIKRENEIKDFSNIMPGHGGILDRLDSLCFVILAYLILFRMI